MSFLLLCFSWAHLTFAGASPIPDIAQPSTAVDGVSSGPTRERTTLQLVWSCLAIIFASTYVCIHPNVPCYKSTWKQRLGARLKISALAVFAPEFIALYAFFQWHGCRSLYHDMMARAGKLGLKIEPQLSSGESSWTRVHAHFLQMGGIVFTDGKDHVYFSEPAHWNREQIKGFFDLKLTEGAILDKSKGDFLAKGLALLQIVWFLVQSAGRWAQGLPFALLETACLAFTAFNFVIYFFWWHKPLNITYPLEVVCEARYEAPEEYEEERFRSRILGRIARCFFESYTLGKLSKNIAEIGCWPCKLDSKLYPTVYWHKSDHDESSANKCTILTFTLISSSFGAIHGMAWHFTFPTLLERQLWRWCTFILTFYPVAHLLVCSIVFFFLEAVGLLVSFGCGRAFSIFTQRGRGVGHSCGQAMETVFGFLLMGALSLAALCYTAARWTILVLPFLQLRSLPEAINLTIIWSDFLPHI